MPLTMVGAGEPVTIKRIGGKAETKKFLESLGFHIGEEIMIVSTKPGKTLLFK